MSVINKMLRDLDSRQGAALPVKTQALRSGIARDTLLVSDSDRSGHRRDWRWPTILLTSALVALAGAAAAWWYLNQGRSVPRKVEPATVVSGVAANQPVVAAALPASAPAPSAAPSTLASAAIPAAVPASASATPVEVSAPTPPAAAARVPKTAPAPKPIPAPAVKQPAMLAQPVKPSPAASIAAAPAPVAAIPSSGVPVQRAAPALETLAQAQALWNAGSRAAATDLLRDALLLLERSPAAGAPPGNNLVLATLVRELARMQLAQGQVREALELLTRLEPALSDVADIWAMRGNAAQRLGQHADSAAAYQRALKLRPSEPRWMLGAAVSLAALGQLAAAAELAEQARSAGALSPEVAAYLRQSGVILRER